MLPLQPCVCWAGRNLLRCEKRQLGSAEDYKILAQSNCTVLDGVDDAAHFRGVQKALDTIEIDRDQQMQARETGATRARLEPLFQRCLGWSTGYSLCRRVPPRFPSQLQCRVLPCTCGIDYRKHGAFSEVPKVRSRTRTLPYSYPPVDCLEYLSHTLYAGGDTLWEGYLLQYGFSYCRAGDLSECGRTQGVPCAPLR